MTVLAIEGYALNYASARGEVRILDQIDMSISRGEVLGLVGESGSAKSSPRQCHHPGPARKGDIRGRTHCTVRRRSHDAG